LGKDVHVNEKMQKMFHFLHCFSNLSPSAQVEPSPGIATVLLKVLRSLSTNSTAQTTTALRAHGAEYQGPDKGGRGGNAPGRDFSGEGTFGEKKE